MHMILQRLVLAPSIAVAAICAHAQDVVIKPPTGGAVVITDSTGAQDRIRVTDTGQVSIGVLASEPPQANPLCFGQGGLLGACTTDPNGSPQIPLPYFGTTSSTKATFAVSNSGKGGGLSGVAIDSGTGVSGMSLANGPGVSGQSDRGDGVYGESRAGGSGVAGVNKRTGAGVYGRSDLGDGVYGETLRGGSAVAGVQKGNGSGVYGRAEGSGAAVHGESSGGDGVYGETVRGGSGVAGINKGRGAGVYGLGAGGDGVYGETADGGSGVAGTNKGRGAGVYGRSDSGYAMTADGPTSQKRDQGGWAKAMAVIFYDGNGIYSIERCFNSQLPAEKASISPCGITIPKFGKGYIKLDFGFNVGDRFVSATPSVWRSGRSVAISQMGIFSHQSNILELVIRYSDVDAQCTMGVPGCNIGEIEGDTSVPFTVMVF